MGQAGDKSSTGLKPNVAGLLCYLLFWLTGIEFLFVERKDKFVRFHAIQSIVVFGVLTLAFSLILIPIIGWIFGWLVTLLALVLWVVLMIRTFQGVKTKIPIAGAFAERRA